LYPLTSRRSRIIDLVSGDVDNLTKRGETEVFRQAGEPGKLIAGVSHEITLSLQSRALYGDCLDNRHGLRRLQEKRRVCVHHERR
jgi:hypothetical protein